MKVLFPVLLVLVGLLQIAGSAATAAKKTATASKKKAPAGKKAQAKNTAANKAPAKRATHYKPAPPVDPTEGDNVDGDDLTVRRAAVEALGTMNGAVVAVEIGRAHV